MPKGIYDRSQVKHSSIPGIDDVSHYWDKSESNTIELLLDDGILTFPDVCEKIGTSNAFRFKKQNEKNAPMQCCRLSSSKILISRVCYF